MAGIGGAGDLAALVCDNILLRATSLGAPSYGGVRTWVKGTAHWLEPPTYWATKNAKYTPYLLLILIKN